MYEEEEPTPRPLEAAAAGAAGRKLTAAGILLTLLLFLVFFRDATQALPEVLSGQHVIFNQLSEIDRDWTWWLRDYSIALWAIVWPLFYLARRTNPRVFAAVIAADVAFMAVGFLGHLVDANAVLIFLGMRQVLYIHAMGGIAWIVASVVSEFDLRLITWMLYVVAAASAAAGAFQLFFFGLNLGFRTIGIFAHAGTFGYAMVGCASVIAISWLRERTAFWFFASGLLLCLVGTVTSGTRAPMVCVFAIALLAFVSRMERAWIQDFSAAGKGLIRFLFVVTLPLAMVAAFSQAEEIAGRGSILDTNASVGGAGRTDLLVNVLQENERLGFVTQLLGQGLGHGTNAAAIYQYSGETISDSAINALLSQMGFLGVVLFFAVPVGATIFARPLGSMAERLVIAIPIFILGITINIYEIAVFLFPLGFALGFLLRPLAREDAPESVPLADDLAVRPPLNVP